MSSPVVAEATLGVLRGTLAQLDEDVKVIVAKRDPVLARYQPIFKPENLPKLTRDDFLGFLLFQNNQHWNGLHRKGTSMVADMGKLRSALAILLDEGRPIQQRLSLLDTGEPASVSGLGRATLTAILLVAHPDRYGVWNATSQAGLQKLEIWPTFPRKASFGQRYVAVNEVLLDLSSQLGVDLWTLDALWWQLLPSDEASSASPATTPSQLPSSDGASTGQAFGLERQLHDFLNDNWDSTDLGRDWALLTEDQDVVGYEYITPIGRIDLLAKHRKKDAWLVVELKRGQSSDETVAQTLRYMGFVREHLAGKGAQVEGLIIARSGDERIRYALSVAPNVSLMLYEVDFRLKTLPPRAQANVQRRPYF